MTISLALMPRDVIANILHRETIAAIVGAKTFERGEQCLVEQRVLNVEGSTGQLRGVVKPSEPGRAVYRARIWLREEGVAYECTCPIGMQGRFCKHNVAIALAHLESEKRMLESRIGALRVGLLALDQRKLVDALIEEGRHDPQLLLSLAGVVLRDSQPPTSP
jgi:uncharacterized Zn finger protein